MEKQITINNQQFTFKNDDIFALAKFEELTGKNVFKMQEYNLTDTISILYCILTECNQDFNETFDEFKSMVRQDKTIINQFFEFLGENIIENKKKAQQKI